MDNPTLTTKHKKDTLISAKKELIKLKISNKKITTAKKLMLMLFLAYGVLCSSIYFYGEINFIPTHTKTTDYLSLISIPVGFMLFTMIMTLHGNTLSTPINIYVEKNKSPSFKHFFILLFFCSIPYIAIVIITEIKAYNTAPIVTTTLASTLIINIFSVLLSKTLKHQTGIKDLFKQINIDSIYHISILTISQIPAFAIVHFGKFTGEAYISISFTLGILLQRIITKDKTKKISQKNQISLLISILILPLVWETTYGNRIMSKTIFESTGYRRTNATIKTNLDVYEDIKLANQGANKNIYVCKGTDGFYISPVDVLWHGIGDTSLIKPHEATSAIRENYLSIKIIDDQPTKCHDLEEKIHFQSGSSKINNKEEIGRIAKSTQTLINNAAKDGYSIKEIIITGHADIRPIKKETNQELSLERAQAAAKYLQSLLMENTKITTIGNSAFPTNNRCHELENKDEALECFELERTASIRFLFEKNKN